MTMISSSVEGRNFFFEFTSGIAQGKINPPWQRARGLEWPEFCIDSVRRAPRDTDTTFPRLMGKT